MEQNPALMARQLTENVQQIAKTTDEVIKARNTLLIADAEYMDAQVRVYREKSAVMSATAAEKWSKIDTNEEWKERERAKATLQNLQDRLRVLETGNNNLKMAIKLTELEIHNLNL